MINKGIFFSKKLPPNYRIHMDDRNASENIAIYLNNYIESHSSKNLVIVCIGTDRSTGDSLGPLVGTVLKEKPLTNFHIYGTLEEPVHAVNLEEKLEQIHDTFANPFIVGVDACLGRLNSVGHITIGKGPVKPGAAVKKALPEVGDIHITGIVNVGGMMEYFVLQNTRLHVVMKMAEKIAASIRLADNYLANISEPNKSTLHSLKTNLFAYKQKESHL